MLVIHTLICETLKQFYRGCYIDNWEGANWCFISIKTKREGEKELSLFRENASTDGIHGHEVSSFLKPAVNCLNDNHSRFNGSWYTRIFLYSHVLFFFERRQKAFQIKYSPLTWTSLSCMNFSMCNTDKNLKSILSQRELT